MTTKSILSSPEELQKFKVYRYQDNAWSWGVGTNANYEHESTPYFLHTSEPIIKIKTDGPTSSVVNLDIPTYAVSIHALCLLGKSVMIPDNTLVGKIIITYEDDTTTEQDLVTGLNIAEWAYERQDVPYVISHRQPNNVGFAYRTKRDSKYSYNGKVYYVRCNPLRSKKVKSVSLNLETQASISIRGLTVEYFLKDSNVQEKPNNPIAGETWWDEEKKIREIFNGTTWEVMFVDNSVLPKAEIISYAGDLKVNDTILIDYIYTAGSDNSVEGTSEIQWYASENDVPNGLYTTISGATHEGLLITGDLLHKYIKVEVKPVSSTGKIGKSVSLVLGKVDNKTIEFSAENVGIQFSSVWQEGEVLTGYYNLKSDLVEGNTIKKWYRSSTEFGTYSPIPNATSNTYTLTADDLDKYIRYYVVPAVVGNSFNPSIQTFGEPVFSDYISITYRPCYVSGVSVTGSSVIGDVLTVDYTFSDVDGILEGETIIEWYALDYMRLELWEENFNPLATYNIDVSNMMELLQRGTSKVLRVPDTDLTSLKILARIYPKNANGKVGKPVNKYAGDTIQPYLVLFPTVDVTYSGTPSVNEVLTAQYSLSNMDTEIEGETYVKWYRLIPDVGRVLVGTGLNYTVQEDDRGKTIRIEVIGSTANKIVDKTLIKGKPFYNTWDIGINS